MQRTRRTEVRCSEIVVWRNSWKSLLRSLFRAKFSDHGVHISATRTEELRGQLTNSVGKQSCSDDEYFTVNKTHQLANIQVDLTRTDSSRADGGPEIQTVSLPSMTQQVPRAHSTGTEPREETRCEALKPARSATCRRHVPNTSNNWLVQFWQACFFFFLLSFFFARLVMPGVEPASAFAGEEAAARARAPRPCRLQQTLFASWREPTCVFPYPISPFHSWPDRDSRDFITTVMRSPFRATFFSHSLLSPDSPSIRA